MSSPYQYTGNCLERRERTVFRPIRSLTAAFPLPFVV
jgi:hypothetical protein